MKKVLAISGNRCYYYYRERNKDMAKKEKISISIDSELLKKVKELALIENRNTSNVIETALIEYMKKKK